MPSGKDLSQDAVDMIQYMHQVHKLSNVKIGKLVGKPQSYIGRILDSIDSTTGLRKQKNKGRPIPTTIKHFKRIRELALANPYIGCEALTKIFNEESDLKLSKSSLHRRLKEVGVEVVRIPATTKDLQDKKTYPNSQTVWKFAEIQEKKKRKKRQFLEDFLKNSLIENEIPEELPEKLPKELPVDDEPQHEIQMSVHTINILIDPSLGIPQITQFS